MPFFASSAPHIGATRNSLPARNSYLVVSSRSSGRPGTPAPATGQRRTGPVGFGRVGVEVRKQPLPQLQVLAVDRGVRVAVRQGCLYAGVDQPDMLMNAGLNTFHCRSRTYD